MYMFYNYNTLCNKGEDSEIAEGDDSEDPEDTVNDEVSNQLQVPDTANNYRKQSCHM